LSVRIQFVHASILYNVNIHLNGYRLNKITMQQMMHWILLK